MKYALIAPTEFSHTGWRVAQVESVPFEVANPLNWVECDDDAKADVWFFDTQDNIVKIIPQLQTV